MLNQFQILNYFCCCYFLTVAKFCIVGRLQAIIVHSLKKDKALKIVVVKSSNCGLDVYEIWEIFEVCFPILFL